MNMITGQITFDLPEPLVAEPFIIHDFMPQEMFQRLKDAVNRLGMGPQGNLKYHTMIGRWESSLSLPKDIEEYCLAEARKIFKDDTLQKAYFFVVRYQKINGCVPNLWEHTDQNGTQTTIDLTIENSADWDLIVEGNRYKQPENSGVIFAGQQHWHSRPPYPTEDETVHTTVLFMHFTQPDHWIQSDNRGIYRYGRDGDVRFFNKHRYLPFPDHPLGQDVCECHDYSNVLSLYDFIAGPYTDTPTEVTDMSFSSSEELAPGIVSYSFDKSSARTIKGMIQNACRYQWEAGQVYREGVVVDTKARIVSNYFLGPRQTTCHPQDPISRIYLSLENGMEPIISDYASRYSLSGLKGGDFVLLRYETGNMYHYHYDASPQYPRIVSAIVLLNEDFDGGELEFKEFGLKVPSEAGKVILFPSSFAYMHRVNPVIRGVRYSVVRWYQY